MVLRACAFGQLRAVICALRPCLLNLCGRTYMGMMGGVEAEWSTEEQVKESGSTRKQFVTKMYVCGRKVRL